MNKQKGLTPQRWALCNLALVLVFASGLAGCTIEPTPTATPTLSPTPPQPPIPTPSPPPAPVINPPGPVTVEAGKTIPVYASAKGADRYEWTLMGEGEISTSTGPAILYTAPEEGDAIAILTVTAYNAQGSSPQTSLTINIPALPPTPPPTLPPFVLIKPTVDTVLISDDIVDCPIPIARGEIQTQGTINLSGLEPGQTYHLTLNGKPGALNDELCKINCTNSREGYWDFMTVIADAKGQVSNKRLEAFLPSDVELFPGRTYEAKFFVKNALYCTVLGNNDFLFTTEPSQ